MSEHEDVCYLLSGNYFGTSVGAEYSYYYDVCTEIAFTGTLNDKATNIKELANLKGGERVIITANQKVTWTATNEKTLIKVAKSDTTYSFTAPKSGTFTIKAKGVCDPKASKSVSVKVVEQKPANDKPFDKELFIKELYLAMKEFGITQPNDMAGFLANVEHETGGFKKVTEGEGLRYSFSAWKKLDNKNAQRWTKERGVNAESEFAKLSEQDKINIMYKGMNGNTEPNDGWVYRGRGAMQLTGRANYQAFADYAKRPDIMKNPELIAKDMNLAARSSAWFWKKHSQASKKSLKWRF